MSKNYKPFGTSPEKIEEDFPKKIVKGVGEEAHKTINALWDQMLGGGHDKTSSHDAPPPPYDAKSAPPPYDAPPSYEASQAKANEKSTLGEVLFQLGIHSKKSENAPQNLAESSERRVEAGIDYHGEYFRDINNFREKGEQKKHNEVTQKIEEIIKQLKELIASTKALDNQFADIVVAPPPKKPGKYHENFFEWLLIMIKQARQKVDSSNAWLGAIKGKNGKKNNDYWGRAEKEGTTFTQSNERSVSTSVG
jgi:hypothetical protein